MRLARGAGIDGLAGMSASLAARACGSSARCS